MKFGRKTKTLVVELSDRPFNAIDEGLYTKAQETNDPDDWQAVMDNIRVIRERSLFLRSRREERLARNTEHIGAVVVQKSHYDDSTAIRVGNFVGVDDLPADGWPDEFKPDTIRRILDILPED